MSLLQRAQATTFKPGTTWLFHISNYSHHSLPFSTLHNTLKSHINTKQGKHMQIAQFSNFDLQITYLAFPVHPKSCNI